MRQLDGRKRRTVDAIATGTSAEHHDCITGRDIAWVAIARSDTDRTAENQRIGDIAGVIKDRTVDNGDTDFVAVVLDASNHPVGDLERRQDGPSKGAQVSRYRAEAKDIGGSNGFGRYAEDVAEHAAHSGIGTTERFECRRMVVCLDLE